MATMMTSNRDELYDQSASLYVLSCLMHDPLLLQNEKYAFVKTDFYKPLQQMVFFAVYNMAQNGAEKITPQDVDTYLSSYESQYAYYKANNGFEFVLQCYKTTEGSDRSQFEYYYGVLKKFSVLRDLESIGINTSRYFNPSNILNQDAELEKLNKMSIETILNDVRGRIVNIENRHVGKDEGTASNIAAGMRELVNDLKEHPEVGLPLDGEVFNYATRGARLGKMYIFSAPSGGGKTRCLVDNACVLSMPYIGNDGKIVVRGRADGTDYQKVCYVATEQGKDEIQTLVLAHVSGVSESKILLSQYTDEEWNRIKLALDIIDRYADNFILDCIPDPSIAMLKARLTKYIVQDNIDYIFYDYIFSSPGLVNEFAASELREDVVLMMLSNSLKELAMTYNVFLMSATQLNDGWAKKAVGPRDQNCIRGSKAIADKADIGAIGVALSEEEKGQIEALWTEIKRKAANELATKQDLTEEDKELRQLIVKIPYPNQVVDLYKNRRGELKAIKIFRYFDFATCRATDLFVTDGSYKHVDNIGIFKYEKHKVDFAALKVQNANVAAATTQTGGTK